MGTSTIKIYSLRRNKAYIEKNTIAIKDEQKPLAVGDDAYEMFEKAPKNIYVHSPMAFGMIANAKHMSIALYRFLKKIDWSLGVRPTLYFAIPTDLSQIEKRAYYSIVNMAPFRSNKVYVIEKPIADALAMEIPIESTMGSMIVNIGAQTSEMSVIADGKIIISKRVPIGGNQLNEEIIREVRNRYNLQIGTRTARRLKFTLASFKSNHKDARKAIGIGSLSGLPREEIISSLAVNRAIERPMSQIASEIKTFLERTPPQIAYHIYQEGIYLSGGSTRTQDIEKYLQRATGYPFHLSAMHETCTIVGVTKVIRNKKYKKWAVPVSQKKDY